MQYGSSITIDRVTICGHDMTMRRIEDPFYYLLNFQSVLDWLSTHYGDLLAASERDFIREFTSLPTLSQALLVRLIMRKGDLFRSAKIRYAEIGCIPTAAAPLIASGWIDVAPLLTIEQLFQLLKRSELERMFAVRDARKLTKAALLDALRDDHQSSRTLASWTDHLEEFVCQVRVAELCDHLRLIFFGNFRQDWSEFVLADLGIFTYERVALTAASRAFQSRDDIDQFLHLYRCRRQLAEGASLVEILDAIPASPLPNEWLESRRNKLLFQIAQRHEQQGDLSTAYHVYRRSRYSGARLRSIRMLERMGCYREACQLAQQAQLNPESEAERQRVGRVLQRLHHCLGLSRAQQPKLAAGARLELLLQLPDVATRVERCVSEHLAEPQAPVHYVENTLIKSLFGLLCWDAIFAPVPGAFFHEYHAAPADLNAADFCQRRQQRFSACLEQLDSRAYVDTIRDNFARKQNIQSPFVAWGMLDAALLDLALRCIPAAHLRRFFERIMLDINENCTGLPDLIQFWPEQCSYRMIEVKAPGDRLQDNQRRWIDFCATHAIPVTVCHVRWIKAAA